MYHGASPKKRFKPLDHSQFQDFVRVKGVHLTLMSPEEIRRMSVTEVKTDQIYNKNQLPMAHGVNDPRMGTMDRRYECTSCINDNKDCPGHPGHIELPAPFYIHGFIKETLAVLRAVCPFCCRLLVDDSDFKVASILETKDESYTMADRTFAQITALAKGKKFCIRCEMPQPEYKMVQHDPNIRWEWDPDAAVLLANLGLWSTCGRPFNAGDALSILSNVPDEDYLNMGLDIKHSHPAWAIMTVMPVVPPVVRPSIMASEGSKTRGQDDLTWILKRIVKSIKEIRDAMTEKLAVETVPSFTLKCGSDLPKKPKPKKRKKKKDAGNEEEEPQMALEEIQKANLYTQTNPFTCRESLESMNFHPVVDGDLVAIMWERMPKLMEKLQGLLICFVNNEGKVVKQMPQRSGTPMKTLFNRLNSKTGRVRGHLMGKRMDFSGRSVITPGENLDVDQVGVPARMAAVLTIPELVTERNIARLTASVRAGPKGLNGANRILCPDGRVVYVEFFDDAKTVTLQKGWIVERHLRDGDPILFNRQPSLHRMSIMAFKAKILPDDKAFQLHLCATKAFNADFDGDEMNIHVCQNIRALAECMRLCGIEYHIISPQSNAPIVSFVQNSLLSAYLLTCKDVFFTWDEVCQFICILKYPKFEIKNIGPPAILKPVRQWTGKQVFSLLFPKTLCTSFKTKDIDTEGHPALHYLDPYVLVKDGELLTGRLNSKALGTAGTSIVSTFFHDIGSRETIEFLSDGCRLLNAYLQARGFSIGISDCMVSTKTGDTIDSIMADKSYVKEVLEDFEEVKDFMQDAEKDQVEEKVLQMLSSIVERSSRHVFHEHSMETQGHQNAMSAMIDSGAKGKRTNVVSMTVGLGQQIVEGQRPAPGPQGRTLCCFPKGDLDPKARGFVSESYFHGISTASMFAHYMGGREGLVDTAVKTANTGYLQRQLVKAFEAIVLTANKLVMEEGRTVVQYRYGDDGMDPCGVEMCPFGWLAYSNAQLRSLTDSEEWYRMMRVTRDSARTLRVSILFPDPPKSTVLPMNLHRHLKDTFANSRAKGELLDTKTLFKAIRSACRWMRKTVGHEASACMRLALLCELSPKNLDRLKVSNEAALHLVALTRDKFLWSLAQTGEMLGIVAAQSVGEPATQMTLNTFHFAGKGSKQLSQGVPRFVEIVNMSPSPRTPYLFLALLDPTEESAKKVARAITCIPLGSITQDPFVIHDPATVDGPLTTLKAHLPLMTFAEEVFGREADGASEDMVPSPYVICLVLKKEVMIEKDITPFMVAKAIETSFPSSVMTIIYSEVNMGSWLIRLRLWNMEDEISVRAFPSLLMKKVTLGGVKGVSFAQPALYKTPQVDPKTGEYTMVDEWKVDVQGSGLLAVAQIKGVDWSRSTTNNILEAHSVLGIDACRQVILKELHAVLSNDGAYVDLRHLQLLADSLTFRGFPMTTTRHGQNRVDKGPLIRASFEGTQDMIHHAAYFAERDKMLGLTQNMMLGQIAPMGTGMFGIQRQEATEPKRSQIEDHALRSGLAALEPRHKDRIDRKTGIVFGTHEAARRDEVRDPEVESKAPHKRVTFDTRPPRPDAEELIGDFDTLKEHLEKKKRIKTDGHHPKASTRDQSFRMGAYASLRPSLTSAVPLANDEVFGGSDAAIIDPWSEEVMKEPQSEREVRLQAYRTYLEKMRHSADLGPGQRGDIDLSTAMAKLKQSMKGDKSLCEDIDMRRAFANLGSTEDDPFGVGASEFPTAKGKKVKKGRVKALEATADTLGNRLVLEDLPGFLAEKPKDAFRPSTPELDLI